MRLLLDSHVAYWALTCPEKLRTETVATLVDPENDLFVSSATVWELSIKAANGKLTLPSGFTTVLREEAFSELPITWLHSERSAILPQHHSDPFDRLLIAQALIEGLILVTRDSKIRQYDVPLMSA